MLKAYCTRVGGGPFPSELSDEDGERLRANGAEFGVVTGRPRRCGWLDVPAAHYAARINGLTGIVLTKLDVLTGFKRVGMVVGYRLGGKPVAFGAVGTPGLEPQLEYLEGWSEDLRGVRRIEDLPPAALAYVRRIESMLGVPIQCVSVGPERSELAM